MKKPLLFGALTMLALVLIVALRHQNIDLETLRIWLANADTWREERLVTFAVTFFATYVMVTALSLPFAVWMTLAAGALFGFWGGVLIVSFASTIGATLAFLAARYLLRDWVRDRLGDRIRVIEEGMARDGASYLFTLRLIPVVPFFAVNLLMGLTPIRAVTFYLVSQVGMLAGTAVYVNAGTQLAQLEGLSGVASLALLFSFAVLGLFPWISRMFLNFLKRRKTYARWKKPSRFDRNLIVIGAGAAGLVLSYIVAATGSEVTQIERAPGS